MKFLKIMYLMLDTAFIFTDQATVRFQSLALFRQTLISHPQKNKAFLNF